MRRRQGVRRQDVWDGGDGPFAPPPAALHGVVPRRTADPAEARRLFAEHGAVILTGRGAEFDDAAAIPQLVFGEAGVRSYLPPIKIA